MAEGEGEPQVLSGLGIDVSHQEVDQILDELEQIYFNQPTEWLGVRDIGLMLAHMMYEDMDELEDAIKGTIEDFVCALPHVETKMLDGKLVYRIKPEPPISTRRQLTLTFEVKTSADLRRCLLKAPDARLELPSIEFEIGADTKRAINSLYNHIAIAKMNLGFHAESNVASMGAEEHTRILETIEQLSALLDVNEPYKVVLHDPSGLSELKPADGAVFEWGEQAIARDTGPRPQFDPNNVEVATYADAD
jgi:mediator of RNA polymerase II transcription subunit 31